MYYLTPGDIYIYIYKDKIYAIHILLNFKLLDFFLTSKKLCTNKNVCQVDE